MTTQSKKINRPSVSLELQRIVALFANHCRARNLSPETIAWYNQRFGHFIDWFKANFGNPPSLADLTLSNFQLFVLEKQGSPAYEDHPFRRKRERPVSSSYIHGYYRAVRSLGRWLERQQLVKKNPLQGLELPKVEERELRALEVSEEQHLLGSYKENTAAGARLKAIFMLMLDAGLRRSELLGLKYEDANLDEGFLLVRGKGRKERWIPFGYKTGWALQRYAMLYRPEPAMPQVENFFLDPDGYPMTRTALKMIFERAKVKTGIARLHPHLLRHTFGLRSQELNMPSLVLQRYMGHSDVRTTERYAHAAQSEKLKRQRHYSHLDQMSVRVSKVARHAQKVS